MNEKDLENKAIEEIERVAADGPPEPRVVHCEAETEWYPDLLCNLSEHRLHVLGRRSDIIVFFDDEGKEIGWRDDGRTGARQPGWIARDVLLGFVVQELDLPKQTRLGKLAPRELPPLGWTHEAVLFLSPTPTPDQVVRVWVNPETHRVIQCLYGPVTPQGTAS